MKTYEELVAAILLEVASAFNRMSAELNRSQEYPEDVIADALTEALARMNFMIRLGKGGGALPTYDTAPEAVEQALQRMVEQLTETARAIDPTAHYSVKIARVDKAR